MGRVKGCLAGQEKTKSMNDAPQASDNKDEEAEGIMISERVKGR